jgi:hypothetical protein
MACVQMGLIVINGVKQALFKVAYIEKGQTYE